MAHPILNLFHQNQEKPAEEIEPIATPPAAAEARPKPDPIKPIQINDEKYVLLLKALRPKDKIERILQDLKVDESRAKSVMAGASQPPAANSAFLSSRETPGPIV